MYHIMQTRAEGILHGLRKPHRTVFVGDTSCGKSWTINMMLLMTSTDPASYCSQETQAARQQMKGEKLPEEHEFKKPLFLEVLQEGSHQNTVIEVLSKADKEEIHGRGDFDNDLRSLTTAIAQWRDNNDDIFHKGFLLPSVKQHGTTTPYIIRIKEGLTWHMQYKVKSADDAADQVQNYVKILIKVSPMPIHTNPCPW